MGERAASAVAREVGRASTLSHTLPPSVVVQFGDRVGAHAQARDARRARAGHLRAEAAAREAHSPGERLDHAGGAHDALLSLPRGERLRGPRGLHALPVGPGQPNPLPHGRRGRQVLHRAARPAAGARHPPDGPAWPLLQYHGCPIPSASALAAHPCCRSRPGGCSWLSSARATRSASSRCSRKRRCVCAFLVGRVLPQHKGEEGPCTRRHSAQREKDGERGQAG